jgi:hypothetical protein
MLAIILFSTIATLFAITSIIAGARADAPENTRDEGCDGDDFAPAGLGHVSPLHPAQTGTSVVSFPDGAGSIVVQPPHRFGDRT